MLNQETNQSKTFPFALLLALIIAMVSSTPVAAMTLDDLILRTEPIEVEPDGLRTEPIEVEPDGLRTEPIEVEPDGLK